MRRAALVIAVVTHGVQAAFAPQFGLSPALPLARHRGSPAPAIISRPAPVMMAASLTKALKFLRGDGITSERVPCGDDELDECYALCDEEGECEVAIKVDLLQTLKIGLYFALWFGLSTGYNLQNKVRLNLLPLPWSQSAFSLFVGSAFVMPLWLSGLRKAPKLNKDAIQTLLPIAFCHSIGHSTLLQQPKSMPPVSSRARARLSPRTPTPSLRAHHCARTLPTTREG
jgi:hypothetical protein